MLHCYTTENYVDPFLFIAKITQIHKEVFQSASAALPARPQSHPSVLGKRGRVLLSSSSSQAFPSIYLTPSPATAAAKDAASSPHKTACGLCRRGVCKGLLLSSSSSVDSTTHSSRRRNMPMMYQMYESQYEDLRGTVYGPDSPDFHPAQAGEMLRKALHGIETSDRTIIDILVQHNNFQRQKILSAYEDMHETNLLSDIEEEAGGFFLDLCLALFKPAHVYDTLELYKSISNRYGDRSVGVEIACTRSPRQLKVIREQYQTDFKKTVEKDIGVKVEGNFGRMLSMLLCKQRDELGRKVDEDLVNQHAQLILSQTLDDLSRNVVVFDQIFTTRSWRHIDAVITRADEMRGDRRDFETLLRKNKTMHSETRLMLLTIVQVARNCQLYFAEKLKSAMSGDRPDHATIIRVVVSRSEIDLADIGEEYKRRYQRSLDTDIAQTCSGEYLKLLLALIAPRSQPNY